MSIPDSMLMEGNQGTSYLDEILPQLGGDFGFEDKDGAAATDGDGGDKKPPKETKNDTDGGDEPEPEYEITVSGKKKKLPLSKILRQAEQVGGLTDKLHELKELAEVGRTYLETKGKGEEDTSTPKSFKEVLGGDDQLSPFGGTGFNTATINKVAGALDALNEKIVDIESAGSFLFGERMVNTLSTFVKEHPIVDKDSDSCNEEVMGAFVQQLEEFGVRKAFQNPSPETAKRLGRVLDLAYRAAAFEHQVDAGKKEMADKISRREKELAAGGSAGSASPGGKATDKPKRLGQGFQAAREDILEELGLIASR